MYAERLLPSNIEAEEAVLGSIITDESVLAGVAAMIRPVDFMREKNGQIFQGCVSLYQRHEPVDQITLARELEVTGQLHNLGGMSYLSHLVAITPTSVHAAHYAALVARTAALRRLIQAAARIAEVGYDDTQDVALAFRRAEELLAEAGVGMVDQDWVSLRELLDQFLMDRAALTEPGDQASAPINSGYVYLDELLGGIQRSNLLVLGARPGVGKSALALNVALNAAKNGATVGVFSLEMSVKQLVTRILASEADVAANLLGLGLYSEAAEQRITDAIGTLSELPIYFDESSLQTTTTMRSKADRLAHAHGLDLLVVDYLQLVHGKSQRPGAGENRVQEISEISRSLKGLARDLNIAVIACSQLSRAVETRPGHRPQLADLRDSGSIEQDADVVMFIFREDMYYTEAEWEQSFPSRPYPENIAEIILAKHRHGPIGSVRMYFQPAYVRFNDLPADALPAPVQGDFLAAG